jgi:hypothetical protein
MMTNSNIRFAINSDAKTLISVSGDSSEVMFYGAELLTVKLLLKYEIECYNDSTKVRTHKNEGEYEGLCLTYDGKECNADGHHKHIWRHKEPVFKDFIYWLKNKTK